MTVEGISLPKVSVVDPSPSHQESLRAALDKHFDITFFKDSSYALDKFYQTPPNVAIIDDSAPKVDGQKLAELIFTDPQLMKIPVIMTGKYVPINAHNVGSGKARNYLQWPFKKIQIFEELSSVINDAAVTEWEVLPEVHKQALTMTVTEYQDIADAISKGEPIQYDTAKESCAPLLEAISSGGAQDLLKSVQSHHNYTYVHSLRVATLLTMFGHGIGMRGDNLSIMATGGLLHDVGKMVTPENILSKPGKLDDDEWPIMQGHVLHSRDLLQAGSDITKGARIIAEQHHEKIDGSGYPLGLKGKEMSELARMSSICDIFGALTDSRSYKPAFSAEKSFAILADMGPSIDQGLLKVFKELISDTKTVG